MFSVHNGIKLQVSDRKIHGKFPNIWKLTQFQPPRVKEDVSRKIRKYFELKENQNIAYQKLRKAAKAIWRGKCIALSD